MANALAKETSPYLLQHADNPVDWLPWGEPAFAKARELDRPVFLSIGYSTCHWCHVMERESFSNGEIAELMNREFVNIKVDREERPDVDLTYMTYVQAAAGGGGWPMSVWLTPDLKPILGGTYYPPEDKRGRPGFKRVLEEVAKAWREDRKGIIERGEEITEKLQQLLRGETAPDPSLPLLPDYDLAHFLDRVMSDVSGRFDYHQGGFSTSPKFPRMAVHLLLHDLHRVLSARDPQQADWALEMSTRTLSHMIIGGIHDQLGGGFHRYSVDGYWHVPHFEKMLHDQALIATAMLEAWQLSGKKSLADTARETFAYVARDLTHPDGGFYSAEDADSLPSAGARTKLEGAFYTWEAAEVDRLLGPEDGPVFRFAYGIRKDGNARPESDPQGELKGRNTLFRANSPQRLAEEFEMPLKAVRELIARGRRRLLEQRGKRPRPHLDDKVITSWNGLMISALALGARCLDDPQLLERAQRAAGFIRRHMTGPEGELRRCFRNGVAVVPAFAADYACLIQALLDLYQSDFDTGWLQWARELQQQMDQRFLDHEHGGYFSVLGGRHGSILSIKEDYDGAEPSPNAVAARNLFRLATMFHHEPWREQAEAILRMSRKSIEESPAAVPLMIDALLWTQVTPRQVVVAFDDDSRKTAQPLLRELHRRHLPQTVVLAADGGQGQQWLAQHIPALAGMTPVDGRPAVYICEDYSCRQPVTDVAELSAALEAGSPAGVEG